LKNKSFNDILKKKCFNLFYRWENVRLDLYIFEYFLSTKYKKKVRGKVTSLPVTWLLVTSGQACAMVRSPSSIPLKYDFVTTHILLIELFSPLNKIFEMKNISLNDIFFFNLFYRWENVRLDFFNFGWYLFI
jgi:hypothetical protein